MRTISLDDFIYTAYDEDNAPDWDQFNIYDASPVGLSGRKEGFYFANWLMPFRVPFVINQVAIYPDGYPICIVRDGYDCAICNFFDQNTCPILLDIANLKFTRKGFETYQKLIFWPRGSLYRIFEASQNELLSHGKPLHFHMLSTILRKRYPTIGITDRKVHRILKINPIFFHFLENGVYEAIKGVEKSEGCPTIFFWGITVDIIEDI